MDSIVWLWTLHMKMTFIMGCAQSLSCVWLCNPMDCSPPGSSVRGILQARILESVAMPSSRGSSQPRDQTQVSCPGGGFFTSQDTREAQLDSYKGPYFHVVKFLFCFCLYCASCLGSLLEKLSHIQVLNTVRNSALFSSSNCWISIFTSNSLIYSEFFWYAVSIKLGYNHWLFWES